MNKVFVTEEQFKKLEEANESVRGTPDWMKYHCALSFKINGRWIHSLYTAPVFNKGYFKKVRGELYIYHIDGEDRYRLDKECIELLGLNN